MSLALEPDLENEVRRKAAERGQNAGAYLFIRHGCHPFRLARANRR